MTPAAKEGLPAVVGELVARWRSDERNLADPAADLVIATNHRRADELESTLSALTAEAGKGLPLADAVQWAHDEFEDKEHVARVRGDTGLADYYGLCKAKMALALSTATPAGEWVLVPKVPTAAMLACIARSEWPQDWEAGKRLQRDAGCDVVFPKTEIECAVGQYERMLAASPRGADAGE